MRFLYNFFTYLLLIPFTVYWISRGISNRSYRDRLTQRLGFGFPKLQNSIWIHAVSVGEVQAAVPLIHALIERFPQQIIIVTTVTPTGASRVADLFGEKVVHCYMPFEFPHAIRSFFKAVEPRAAMIMETEIWPNLYQRLRYSQYPIDSCQRTHISQINSGLPAIGVTHSRDLVVRYYYCSAIPGRC